MEPRPLLNIIILRISDNVTLFQIEILCLFQDIEKDRNSSVNASIRLVNLTNDSPNFENDDVSLTVLILENIVAETEALNQVGLKLKHGVCRA